MINPTEIKVKANRKYIFYLQNIAQELPFSRIIIRGDKSYSKSLSDYEKEILALLNQSKEKKGFGYSIDYHTVKTKSLGVQSLPDCIYFDTEKDFLKYLGKEKEIEIFKQNCGKILSHFPELKNWVIQNPGKLILNQDEWERILNVCNYFKITPKPNLYIRELPISIHTKFIEKNQSIIRELLDLIIKEYINNDEKDFEKRFNLKCSEPQVRFKILDKEISRKFFSCLDDIAIPVNNFENLKLPVNKVLIVENKTSLYTTLTLPKMDNSIAVFGSGSSVNNLKSIKWFNEVDLLYWGDIDVQGFEILSQFRCYFPRTKSVLMDQTTFEIFFDNDSGTPTKNNNQLNLTDNEKQLYNLLKNKNWRLEQEKIPFAYVNDFFDDE